MDGAGEKAGGLGSPVVEILDEIYRRHRDVSDGAVATYIPELSKVDPDRFGLAVAMPDGQVYEAGDCATLFTLQSISKPIVYGLALKDNGLAGVMARIGVAPSGDAFNAIHFDAATNRPFNPMVNSGAIVAASLVGGRTPAERLARVMDMLGAFAGRTLSIDEAVFRSERDTGHRNRAIAHLELASGMIEGDIDEHLDLYFRQCSVLVTARDVAVMAATLANGGVNPLTGIRALATDLVRHVLSLMTSCGMYDYAGEWEFDVGMPAKSGVGGGIMAALPGELGIGVFSPRLDPHGNSVRGVGVCRDLAARLRLHMLDHRGAVRAPVRRRYRGDVVRSTRQRPAAAQRALDGLARSIVVFELQGDLRFANMEALAREAVAALPGASHIVLDAQRVSSISAVANDMLARLRRRIVEAGRAMVFIPAAASAAPAAGSGAPAASGAASGRPARAATDDDGRTAPDVDTALERAETELLRRAGFDTDDAAARAELAEFEFLDRLDAGGVAALARHLAAAELPAGSVLIEEGAEADSVYFLVRGVVEIGIGAVRLGTVEAGNVLGEVALLGPGRRTATVRARTAVGVLVLTADAAARLHEEAPDVQRELLLAVGRSLRERLRRANLEIQAHAP
ncbi:MAG: glutaminase A [Rhodospirillales bacterium]|nr:MAG: glutaminase A [Rhodospirillales bacterium]